MNQPVEQITRRLISAIRNPYVDIIGHPSGRELPHSSGRELDWPAIFEAARENQTALEINSNPLHLDLDDVRARKAAESCSSLLEFDAHQIDAIKQIRHRYRAAHG